MNGFTALVLDEMRRRRLLFVGAALCGLFPLVTPWLAPSLAPRHVLPAAVALLGAWLFALVTALTAGSDLLSRDLANGRLAFFLRLPLSAHGLWLGRVVAALLAVAVVLGAVLLPTALIYDLSLGVPDAPQLNVPGFGGWLNAPLSDQDMRLFVPVELPWMVLVPLSLLAVLVVGHVGGLALRLRDPWTLADLAGVVLCALLVGSSVDALIHVDAWAAAGRLLLVVLLGLTAAAGVGGWLQLRRGGVDSVRSHRLHVLVVWPAMLVLCVAGALWARSVLHPSLGQLDTVTVAAVSDEWAVVGGPVGESGFHPTFVLPASEIVADARPSSGLYLGSHHDVSTLPLYSKALERLVWIDCDRYRCALRSIDPRDTSARPVALDLGVAIDLSLWADPSLELDATGRHLAVASRGAVQVIDLEARRLVFEDRYADGEGPAVLYPLAREGRWMLRVLPWDIDAGPPRDLILDLGAGTLEAPAAESPPAAPADGARHRALLLPERGQVEVLDPETARVVLTVPAPLRLFRDARALADGGVAVLERVVAPSGLVEGLRLVRWSADGVLVSTLAIDGVDGFLGGQPSAGRLWLGVGRGDEDVAANRACAPPGRAPGLQSETAALLVDLESATVAETVAGAVPLRPELAGDRAWLVGCDGWPRPAPG